MDYADASKALVLYTLLKTRKRASATVEDLRRKVVAERRRWEWSRAVRMRHYLTLECIKDPEGSPWMNVWKHGTDKNFLALTSLTRASFCRLLERFMPHYTIVLYSPKGGRPARFRHHHQFGGPPATVSRVITAAEEALSNALIGFDPARITWPSLNRQKALAKLISLRQALVSFTCGFLDGKNYRILQPSNADLQNAHYNGWLHDVFVTGTLCFSADGLIVWAKHNCPGSWNDGDMSLEFRRRLMDRELNPDRRFGVVADSAFPCADEMTGRILTPLKEGDLNRLVPSVREVAKSLSAAITSIRQAAECGVGSIEKVYHRLLLPLPYNQDLRRRRLDNLFRLANYRVRTVGISEIRTTFMYGPEDRQYE
ncbi:hypothetical protein, variant 1 [Phytophthora nicotianae P1569]|uniref:DDE Tnp4 domain-containing protein n=3 Tax=Phytophthora nicotianae P1569 TaxID=1317065 RepID=V9DUP2_PHYNI|nr:hypothetical protein, variant 1 [Phytophthora nicotianae P1569]